MHKEPETLGEILKTARMRADITMETLAERVDITERYLYRIENEGKKPSIGKSTKRTIIKLLFKKQSR